jgi:drug/metabolite transporter (DMT)-like permease
MSRHHSSSSHLVAILQALFVTFLWSTSYILIKIGLRGNLPAVTFAGYRYVVAFLCLTPVVLSHRESRNVLARLTRAEWIQMLLLGFFIFTLAQSTQFISLQYIPPATFTLMFALMPGLVAVSSIFVLREYPTPLQWAGLMLSLAGVALYFLSTSLGKGQPFGVVMAFTSVACLAIAALLGRHLNRQSHLPPLVVTFVSMGIGSILLLLAAVGTQGPGTVTSSQALIIVWLAVANTALAFSLWNHTLQLLTATESSIINTMVLPQTALLAFLFLHEPLSVRQVLGLVLVGAGAIVVQLRRNRPEIITEIAGA